MKKWILVFLSFVFFVISGCGGNDTPSHSCTQNVSGCPSDYYSCPAAAMCYTTEEGCAQSGECPE